MKRWVAGPGDRSRLAGPGWQVQDDRSRVVGPGWQVWGDRSGWQVQGGRSRWQVHVKTIADFSTTE